ncbi:MAG: rhodanese-like domain-containing protein [Erysipelotrichaceae bacterium]
MIISSAQAAELLKNDGVFLLDVREVSEYQNGHLEAAVLIPYDSLAFNADKLPSDKNTTILVYCHSGRRSNIAAKELVKMGYTKVFDFGGIIDWQGKVVVTDK